MERVMPKLTNPNKIRMKYVAALAIFLVIIVLYNRISPSTSALKIPIQDQLQAIQVEDFATAYALTTKDFQKVTSLEAFKRYVNEYSGLRNNQSIDFNEKSIVNGVGTVKATLIARGGIPTDVTYQLVKERNRWRINAIRIKPSGDEPVQPQSPAVAAASAATAASPIAAVVPVTSPTPVADPNAPAPTTDATTAPAPATTAATTPAVATNKEPPLQFSDANYHYSMQYPTSWDYTRADRGITVFFKNDHQATHPIQLTVQPLEFDDNAGHQSVQQVIDLGESAVKDKDSSYQVVEDGLLPPRANKNENFHGRYVVYSYSVNNQPVKQLQVVYFKSPSRAQYVIDFIAPANVFDAELPAARAMIASFAISL